MRRFIFYFLFGLIAFCAAGGMFILKYHVMSKEAQLVRIHRQIVQNNRSIHILKAEWTNLNNPKRLRALLEKDTDLNKITASQIVDWTDIQEKSVNSEDTL